MKNIIALFLCLNLSEQLPPLQQHNLRQLSWLNEENRFKNWIRCSDPSNGNIIAVSGNALVKPDPPTISPSISPSLTPSLSPTLAPTVSPTSSPTTPSPTTPAPTSSPTVVPPCEIAELSLSFENVFSPSACCKSLMGISTGLALGFVSPIDVISPEHCGVGLGSNRNCGLAFEEILTALSYDVEDDFRIHCEGSYDEMTISIPSQISLSGIVVPEYTPDIFTEFVGTIEDTLRSVTGIADDDPGKTIVVTSINGVEPVRRRRLTDAPPLIVEFDIVLTTVCDSACNEVEVQESVLDDIKEVSMILFEATTASGNFLTILSEEVEKNSFLELDLSEVNVEEYEVPDEAKTAAPSIMVTAAPSMMPSTSLSLPSSSPSHTPTSLPSSSPSHTPTTVPSAIPSVSPSLSPTALPSSMPTTSAPSSMPTAIPSLSPSATPTISSTSSPTDASVCYIVGGVYAIDFLTTADSCCSELDAATNAIVFSNVPYTNYLLPKYCADDNCGQAFAFTIQGAIQLGALPSGTMNLWNTGCAEVRNTVYTDSPSTAPTVVITSAPSTTPSDPCPIVDGAFNVLNLDPSSACCATLQSDAVSVLSSYGANYASHLSAAKCADDECGFGYLQAFEFAESIYVIAGGTKQSWQTACQANYGPATSAPSAAPEPCSIVSGQLDVATLAATDACCSVLDTASSALLFTGASYLDYVNDASCALDDCGAGFTFAITTGVNFGLLPGELIGQWQTACATQRGDRRLEYEGYEDDLREWFQARVVNCFVETLVVGSETTSRLIETYGLPSTTCALPYSRDWDEACDVFAEPVLSDCVDYVLAGLTEEEEEVLGNANLGELANRACLVAGNIIDDAEARECNDRCSDSEGQGFSNDTLQPSVGEGSSFPTITPNDMTSSPTITPDDMTSSPSITPSATTSAPSAISTSEATFFETQEPTDKRKKKELLPEPISVYVVEEVLDVVLPLQLEIVGFLSDPPQYIPGEGNNNGVFNAFVDVLRETLIEILEPGEEAEVIVTAVNGIYVITGGDSDDDSSDGDESSNDDGDNEDLLLMANGNRFLQLTNATTLEIDFALTTEYFCTGECDDEAVGSDIYGDFVGPFGKLVEATEAESTIFADALATNAGEVEELYVYAEDFASISIVPFEPANEQDVVRAASFAASTQTMSDGSTVTRGSLMSSASRLGGVKLLTLVFVALASLAF